MSNINPITEKMVSLYAEGNGSTVEELMSLFEASQKSVITRLSRAGVYKKPEVVKTAQKRGVKTELLQQAENALGLPEGALKNVTVENLEAIVAKVVK
jgi:hypothetical protein